MARELLSIIITLRPESSTRLPNNQGRAAHAWWLNQVRARSPELAEQWHRPNRPRPFTLSGLWSGPEPIWGPLELTPSQTVSLRLTTLDQDTAHMADSLLLQHPPQFIRLGKVNLQVEGVTANADQHPWARPGSYEQLISDYLMQGKHLPSSVQFNFSSYTLFQRSPPAADPHGAGRYYLPLPLPELVMRNLLVRWNAFSPVKAPAELPNFCAHRMLISSHQLQAQTISANGQRGKSSVFCGWVRYALHQCDAYWTGLVHLLAAYAFYAGVGGRTATGLGQCQAVPVGRRR